MVLLLVVIVFHKQTLDSNGKTVAILPSPLNNILPTKNKGLAFEIVIKGSSLSQNMEMILKVRWN